jgi:hypothetical protein
MVVQEEDDAMAQGGGTEDSTANGDKTAQGPKGHEWIGKYVQVRALSSPHTPPHRNDIVE